MEDVSASTNDEDWDKEIENVALDSNPYSKCFNILAESIIMTNVNFIGML